VVPPCAVIRFDAGSGQSETLEADLVVDASGRAALTLSFARRLGWEQPAVTEVGVDLQLRDRRGANPRHCAARLEARS
jgi:hypothetical protein